MSDLTTKFSLPFHYRYLDGISMLQTGDITTSFADNRRKVLSNLEFEDEMTKQSIEFYKNIKELRRKRKYSTLLKTNSKHLKETAL